MVGMGIMGCMATSRQVKRDGETRKNAPCTALYIYIYILSRVLTLVTDISKYMSSNLSKIRDAAEYNLCSRRQLARGERSLYMSGVEIIHTI